MLYHTSRILLFRPLICYPSSKLAGELESPLGCCTGSAVKIVTLAKAHQSRYSLRNIVNIAVHAVFTASTIHLSNVLSCNSVYEFKARQYLSTCMEILNELGGTWSSALRCQHMLQSLMGKYGAPAPRTQGEVPLRIGLEDSSPEDYTNGQQILEMDPETNLEAIFGPLPSLSAAIFPDEQFDSFTGFEPLDFGDECHMEAWL